MLFPRTRLAVSFVLLWVWNALYFLTKTRIFRHVPNMSDLDILVANGTCYSKAGEKLDESFIPCGNEAFGFQTCCGAGDNCLADNACFGKHGDGYGSDLTYQAGCTDPEYNDKSCPDKKGIDQPWIALTLCDDSDGVWGACSQEGNPSTLQPGSYCSCSDTAKFTPTAFKDADSLALYASLPTATGESIKFEGGHTPTGEPTSDSPVETDSPSAGASGTSGGGSNASQTGSQTGGADATQGSSASGNSATASRTGSSGSDPTSSSHGSSNNGSNNSGSNNGGSSDDGSSGLASGAKIGIGVGIAVAVLLLLAIIAVILLRRRKRRQSQATPVATANEVEKGDTKDPSALDPAAAGRISDADPRISDVTGATDKTNNISEADGKPLSGADKPGVTELDSEAVMEVPGQTAHPWDRGAELDGRQVKPASPRRVAELPGSLAAESPPGWVVR